MSKSKKVELRMIEQNEAKEFEELLDREIAHVENLMKPPTEALPKTLAMMTPREVIDTGMELIKKAGLLLLKFNSLSEKFKISLFDKLMKFVEKFKHLLEEHGKKIGMESFSIEVGFPWGVSLACMPICMKLLKISLLKGIRCGFVLLIRGPIQANGLD